VVAVVDARRGEVFAARYHFDGGAPSEWDPAGDELSAPVRYEPQALVDELAADGASGDGPLVLVGNGLARYQDLFDQLGRVETLPGEPLLAPPPETLARLASLRLRRGADPSDPAAVLPHYLREADAAINWEQRVPVAAARNPTPDPAVHGGGPS
jgi:tRNA A37 threonylcarbamoyladenosine modification protein TsaB